MAIEPDYSRYVCDRPEKAHKDGKKPEAFMLPVDKRVEDWHTIEHVDENGVLMKYTLCPSCYVKWQSINKTWQKDFSEFINEGIY